MLAELHPVLGIGLVVALLIGVVAAALYSFRGYEYFARRSLERKYADLRIHGDPQMGDVILTYHTYHGLIAWFTQVTHHVALPADDARQLLGRLLRFNLTWGLVTPGSLLIVPLAILNYFAQARSINQQEQQGGVVKVETTVATEAPVPETVRPPSLFRRIIGWTAAGLCLMFAVSTVVMVVSGEFEALIGGVICIAVFGWVARDWLSKSPVP